jgi:uncharacterized protein YheU (UPF0270 family)
MIMQDESERTVELEPEGGGEEIAPIPVAPGDLEPDTLRAVVESFVLREGTDYGAHETSLDTKVAQVLLQLRRGEAQITFDPATESINVVVTSATGGSERAARQSVR